MHGRIVDVALAATFQIKAVVASMRVGALIDAKELVHAPTREDIAIGSNTNLLVLTNSVSTRFEGTEKSSGCLLGKTSEATKLGEIA